MEPHSLGTRMADNPSERSAANEQPRRSLRRAGSGMADHPKERSATEQGITERAPRRRQRKSGSRSRSFGLSPTSDTATEFAPARDHESHRAGTHGSRYLASPSLDRPLQRSDNARRPSSLTTDWQGGACPGTSTRARDDALDEEIGRRLYQTDDHGSRRHFRRPSQMGPSLEHRSTSRQRHQRHAEDDDLRRESTADSTKAGVGQSAFPMSDDALSAYEVRRASRASTFAGNTRLVSAMRAVPPRQDRGSSPAAVWTERRSCNSIGSPSSALVSPERRVTIDPSVGMDVAKDDPSDGAGQRTPLPAEQDDPAPQFMGSAPHQMSRRASVRSADHVAAANRRRSVAEQLLASGPASPIDQGPLKVRADVSSGRRQSMLVQAAIHQLPKLSEAGALEKRRASMEYRSMALRNKAPEWITRVPSVSPRGGSPSAYSGQEHRGRLKKFEKRLRSCRRLKKSLITTFVGVPLILVVIYFARRVRTSSEDEDALCSSSDCLDHARQLLKSLDTSADPCTLFHSYVCGANKSRPEAQVADALFYAKLVVSSTGGAATTSAPHAADAHQSAISRAMVAMSACHDRPATQTAEPFVNFMEARRIRWPSADSRAQIGMVGVLDVLMDLSVNWRAVLWFDVKLMYLSEDHPPVVTFGEPGALTMLRMRQASSLDDTAYADAVRRVSLYLTNGTTELNNSAIQELHKDEGAIREAVLRTQLDNDILLTLHKVHQLYVRNVSLNEWLAVITKYVKSTAVVSIETRILIMKQQSFNRLASLLEAFSPARLLNVIGWMFAYVYVWMLNNDFVSLSGRTSESASADIHCFLAVHESFGIVQASTIFHATFDTNARREFVYTLFNTISTAVLGRLQASESITNLTKKEVALKISAHMRNRLFPPLPFMMVDQLNILYAAFPSSYGKGATFFDVWLRSKQALQSALFNPFHDSLLTARYRWQSGTALYLYSANLVWLAVAALLPPSYLSRGSPIMTYSGLGFQIARQLVRVADERGRRLDYSGAEISWWEQHGKCALDKAATRREKKAVADLFALDVALAALKNSAASTYEGGLSSLSIKLLKKFSPLQLFFISYCSHFCDDAAEGSAMCNLAVNASDFAEAFGCKRQSPPTCLFA
ncbi:hypothetical protein HPB52_020702 [Rhipicephalus sanguineus]|uniref:Peptidase M13 N-terminal domain-containing protein n=1 Tax=Rhipicephalus sanguineus TaxID=34632 RepID=A0A9D4Q776_RHISA|nr:hypothetical protein HPB52_020702 [Rhipicephalus sanguineus]